MNIRIKAVEFLQNSESNESYSNIALNNYLSQNNLTQADKRLLTRLVLGVTERKITLDYFITKQTGKPISKLDNFVLNTLRVALYQINFMDKIPASAAVDEAVKTVKQSKYKFASGFVNGVLRNFVRTPIMLPNGNTYYDLSVKYSCNQDYIEELISYIGLDNTVFFLQNSILAPPTYIMVNTCKISVDEYCNLLNINNIEYKNTVLDNSLQIISSTNIESLPGYLDGLFYVGDIASQIAVTALEIKQNDTILDMCAAPGGKTAYASILSGGKAQITASDLFDARVNLIKQNALRLGFNNIKAIRHDSTQYNPKLGSFNKIICDVPCSGFGVIRRKPEIRYKSLQDLTTLPSLQYNILENGAKYLTNNGIIMYSTCTLRKQENEDVVNKFLLNNTNFSLINRNGNNFTKLLPNINNSDGFFFALLKKE